MCHGKRHILTIMINEGLLNALAVIFVDKSSPELLVYSACHTFVDHAFSFFSVLLVSLVAFSIRSV